MSAHDYHYIGEDEINHKFGCSKCSAEVWFNKPGIGAPNAVPQQGDEPFRVSNEYLPGGACNPDNGECEG